MTATDIGGRVRVAREERGLTLTDASRVTKLSTCVLLAIERNDFASLPAGVYRKAYLRTVAAEVGLNPHELAADYETQYPSTVDPATTKPAAPWSRRAVLMVIVVALLMAAWFALQLDGESVSARSVAQVGVSE